MPFGSSQWMYNSGDNFYNGQISQSLRFDGSTSKLTRTPSASGNQKKWTTSFWVKRSELGVPHYLWSGGSYSGNDGIAAIYFSDDKIHTYFDTSGANPYGAVNDRLYRDTSAWYHIVWAVDAVNTVQKIWVNGVEETLNSGLNPPNFDYGMNRAGTNQAFGVAAWGGSPDLNGYLAEIVHLDGQYLDETYFGEFKNGVWIPIEITGLTFGTNGFHLSFADSSSIGDDISVNTNDFTPTGLDSYDVVPDSPENNFPTWNPIAPDPTYGITTISEGNLKSQNTAANNKYSEITFRLDETNKYYFEYYNITTTGALQPASFELFASSTNKVSFYITTAGYISLDGSTIGSGFPTLSAGDIVNIAFDGASGKVWFGKNGTYYNASGSATGNPADGSNPIATVTSAIFKMTSTFYQQGAIMNFGQDSTFAGNKTSGSENAQDANGIGDFYDTVPSGYLALCSANLPEPTISPNADTQADDYFNTVTYTGNGTGQSITGVGFQPDWTWIKRRSAVENHWLTDSVRGVTKGLISNSSNAESTRTDQIQSFDTDGFTLGNDGAGYSNVIYNNYVAWNWKAGGTAVSNTDGSITSSVSANTDAGFSIVTYTGTGSSATVGHGLGAVARMLIIKNRSQADNWAVGHTDIGFSKHLQLNVSDASTSASTVFNSTAPTSTVFSIGSNHKTNASSENYVAYCFAEVEGFSRFGKFVGNGLADGAYVFTNFTPAFVMIKDADTNGYNWYMYDNLRKPYNNNSVYLIANSTGVETDYVGDSIDHLSNGFKLRTLAGGRGTNRSNINYIYMAFAENPFKYANAR